MLRHRDDLVCDLAQYYGITDMEELPVSTLAALSCGLPGESRTMMRITGQKLPLDTMLLAAIADKLSILVWMNTKDGQRNRNRPASILSELTNENKQSQIQSYQSGAAFEAARNKILKKGG